MTLIFFFKSSKDLRIHRIQSFTGCLVVIKTRRGCLPGAGSCDMYKRHTGHDGAGSWRGHNSNVIIVRSLGYMEIQLPQRSSLYRGTLLLMTAGSAHSTTSSPYLGSHWMHFTRWGVGSPGCKTNQFHGHPHFDFFL